ncbi:MAG: hypothetical protein JXA99_04950 [Candidatus Lokiarchaeota archaeon]|nr:hypothetical protein [Candidatus Lokiarchaeota archaeon]
MNKYTRMFSIGLEHPSVKQVMEIAEEIINDHKILNINSLYIRAKKKLKIPRKGLNIIIELLLNNKILVDRSRYTKNSVLSNDIRKKIYNLLQVNIGLHFSLIRKIIYSDNKSESSGELIWHLDMLMKFNYIKKVNFHNYTIFIPSDIDDDIGIISFLLNDTLNNKIINLLISNDTLKKKQIHDILKEKRENINYHLNILIDNDIIQYTDNNKLILRKDLRKKTIKLLREIVKKKKIDYMNVNQYTNLKKEES